MCTVQKTDHPLENLVSQLLMCCQVEMELIVISLHRYSAGSVNLLQIYCLRECTVVVKFLFCGQ